MEDSKLSELRNKIDAVDLELLKLLATRMEFVHEVGQLKHNSGAEGNFIRSGREAKMIREIVAKGAGNFPKAALYSMWRSIISASLSVEKGLKIAFLQNKDFDFAKLLIEYFGSFAHYTQYESEDEILAVIDAETVGVLQLESGWWLNLANNKNLKIFAKLGDGVFIVGKLNPEESGQDKTIAITHADKHAGNILADHGKVKLIEMEGFYTEIDDMVVIGNYGL